MKEELGYIVCEDEEDYSNDDLFNISSWGADLSFRELISMYEEGELVKPELQRKYVWDRSEASRFIESILLGLPVPSIFLAQVGKKKLIVDGYQRIMTVYEYIKKGIFSKDKKTFKLSSSDIINERWRGKTFNELTEDDKITLRSTTIHAIVFEQKRPQNDTSLYQIFERINTSGRTLKPQEIRNCIYQGSFNKSLFSMNKVKWWRLLFGMDMEEARMTDIEFILRYIALKNLDYSTITVKQISLKKYLNEFMGVHCNDNKESLDVVEEEFSRTMEYIYNNFGTDAFHSISLKDGTSYVERFHPTIFDAVSISTSIFLKSKENKKILDLKSRHKKLLTDKEFKECISNRTTNVANIKKRICLASKYLYEMEIEL